MKKKGFILVETIVAIVVLTIGLMTIYVSFNAVLANSKKRATYNDVAYIYRTYYIEDFLASLNIEEFVNYYLKESGKKIQIFSCNNPFLYKLDTYVHEQLKNNSATASNITFPDTEKAKMNFCESLVNKLGAKNIYLTNYNINDLKKCTTRAGEIDASCNKEVPDNYNKYEALYTMDTNMIYYLRTISGKDDNAYRLIVQYEDKILDSDDSVSKYFDTKNSKFVCPDGYTDITSVCQNASSKSYFTSKYKGFTCPDSLEDSGVCLKEITREYYANVELVLRSQGS